MQYRIDNLITTQSPLHISDPGAHRYDPEKRRLSYDGAFPCVRTKTIGYHPAANGQAPAYRPTVPFLPGTGLRGGLRRRAAQIVMDAIKLRGGGVSFEMYHILMCGASSPNPSGMTTFLEQVEASRDPFAGLFGGGEKLVHSRSRIGNGFPITPMTLGVLVPTRMAEFATPYTDLLDYDVFTRVDDALRGGVAPHPAILALQPSMVAWLEALAASRENKKAEAKAKKDNKAAKAAAPAEAAPVTPGSDTPEPEADTGKRGLATIAVRECVVPGVPFHSEHFLDTEFSGESMLGLYLLALAAFASEQKLGGGSARGYGRFSLRTTIHTSEGSIEALQLGADGKYTPNEKVESISRAINAWNDYAADVSAAKLEAIFSCAQAA